MRKITKSTRRSITVILILAVILSATAGMIYAKYVTEKNVASGISLTVELGYTIDRTKMQTALGTLSDKGVTALKFATGSEVKDMTAAYENIQADDSGVINLYVSGETAYIAPANTSDSTSVIYAPEDSSQLLAYDGYLESQYGVAGTGLSLKSIDLSNLDTSKATYLWGMFYMNESLENITFGNGFTTSQIKSFSNMFSGCKALTSIDLSKFDGSSSPVTQAMFKDCESLTTLDLSTYNTKDSKFVFNYADDMFSNCKHLTTVTLGANFEFKENEYPAGTLRTQAYLPTPNSSYITNADGKWYVQNDTSVSGMTPADLATYHNGQNKTITYVAVPTTNYLLSVSNMQSALKSLGTQPTSLKFVKGSDVSNLTAVATGLEDTNSTGKISLYMDGTTAYIAPADTTNSTDIIKAPADCSSFLRGNSTYTNLENSLTSLDLSNLDMSDVTNMSSMFNGLKALTSIELGSFNTSKVTNMSNMFAVCNSLTSLDVSGFDTSSVTDMSSMFNGCKAVTTLNVSKFKTSNVTNMVSMFGGCNKLTSLDVSGFDTSKVTNMGTMFSGCNAVTALDVSGFKTSNVTNMNGMFSACKALTTLDVSGFKTSNVTTMSYMFSGCNSLTALDVSGFETGNVTTMSNMFNGCNLLETLDVSGFKTSNVNTMSYMFYNCFKLKTLDIGNFNTGKVTNMLLMFGNCRALESLEFGSSFTTSKVTTMNSMFTGCYKLSSLDLENFDTSSVTAMASMFRFCYDLESLKLGTGFTTSKVTTMNSMFDNCYKLSSLDLKNFDTSNVTNMATMFNKCYALTSLDLSSFNTANVTKMTEMFANCTGLSEVTLGANFKFVGTDGYLPAPDSTLIEGADGNWYIKDGDGTAMTPEEVATNQASVSAAASYVAINPKPSAENDANSTDVSNETTDGTAADSITEEQVQGVQAQSDDGFEPQDTETVTVHAQ